ncbi:MAG TPA: hypothetical protein VEH31_03865 [Streptosporangiaceae bacterium]|nr:hypothetical protein [Streptosporangiaceae bacterium]
MTAAQPEDQVTEGARSLEVRWIFPGQAGTAVAEWWERLPATVESREDIYLIDPQLRGLSVKLRGGSALEVKVYRGSPGILVAAGRVRGRMESWQKWSFPCSPLSTRGATPAGWVPVRKQISRISLASRQVQAHLPGPVGDPGCMVEFTQVHTQGQAWWTVGLEATGPTSLLRRELEAAAAVAFTRALPDGMELDTDHAQSYAEWLCRQPGAETGTGTGTSTPILSSDGRTAEDEPP